MVAESLQASARGLVDFDLLLESPVVRPTSTTGVLKKRFDLLAGGIQLSLVGSEDLHGSSCAAARAFFARLLVTLRP